MTTILESFFGVDGLATCLELLNSFQPPEVGGGGSTPDATGGGAPAAGGCGGAEQMGLLVVMMLVFYFLLIRPQQRQQKERDAMLKALTKGASVRTSGGIRGEIVSIEDHEVTLLIAPKVKVNVLRQNIAGVVGAEGSGSGKQEESSPKKGDKDDTKSKGDEA